MPVSVERDRAIFTYIDPGMGTHTELHSWGTAHRRLWEKLRQSGCRVEVVAVAWEQHVLDRAERVLTSWRGRGITEAEQEAAMLRQAVADTDFEIIERHGGFDAVVERVLQVEELSASTDGPGMIDGFRLWGHSDAAVWVSPFQKGGVTLKGDMLVTPATPFSQRAEPSLLWFETFPNPAPDAGQHGFPA